MVALSHIVDERHQYMEQHMEAIKFQLRLPPDIKIWLETDAQRNDRSMNGQVLAILRERMNQQARAEQAQKMN
jgi:hypothetical protein